MILAARDGEWAALAFLLRSWDDGFYHQMTGVRRASRGHSLGLAAKLKAIEYARSRGARFMRTHNDATNHYILAINRRLGFAPEPGIYWLARTL
ncbi:MAG TPA: GNAT family N-acetyltransferase [Symbiobacteriaceae bacterium]|nr:GNAT family N-acetyltransferase [Symbiobacteriaceae bacterium]